MSDSDMLCQLGHVGSFGLHWFKTSFTDGLCGVCGLVLTVIYVTEIMPYFALCVCFVNKLRTVGKSTCACSHVSYSVTMKAAV